MPKTSHGWVSNPHHDRANFLPARDRVTRRISIYLSTCAGSLSGGRTSAQVGLGHEPLKRSVPFYSDNRAGIITDLAGSDSIEQVFKTPLFIPRCKMAFSIGKGRNEQGTFQQSTFIIINTYAGKALMHVYRQIENKSKHVYRQIENKSNTTDYKQ